MTTAARIAAALVLATGVASQQAARAQGEPTASLDPLLVSATPAGGTLSESFQSVTVIDRQQIESWPAATLADLLAGVAGVDIRRRGEPGVQADVGIRGTGFEQTVILLDGMPMGDPQTGHHNLNLPVPIEHIERIEVVKGPGAMAYGGKATGGVINIVTRKGGDTSLAAQARVGSHDTRSGMLAGAAAWGRSDHRLSLDHLQTDGHLPERRADAELTRGLYTGGADFGRTDLRWGLGAENRDFGAWKFYTADYPDQRERTRTRTAWLAADTRAGEWTLSPQAWRREHDDRFRTIVFGTAYINRHETRVQGLRLAGRRSWGGGVTALGVSHASERIDSNALDRHDRDESQAWLVHRQPLGQRTALEAGLTLVDYSDYGSYGLPSIAVRHRIGEHWTAFASVARSARVPSYTELFLQTSGNLGNPDLEPERSDYAEAGLRFRAGAHRLNLALFERRTDRLIDWARSPGEVQWQADQFEGHRSQGGEVEWRWFPAHRWLERVDLAATVLDTELDDRGLEIKYALDHVELGLTGGAVWRLAEALRLTTRARYTDRSSGESGTLLDLRLGWQLSGVELFVEGNNLLDERLVEAGFAPLPGRWLYAGIRADY
ncbi:TonB-dependent receptor plug domain-containing protein [Wenzhouxiangella sediminis]|uniref:TonB-dependent receptor n=1 Tax=Wenzhouxiangella sediminis TaxID=1792836 RepID=A0A3E1K6N9_9GAMM|nr:TonB-dependent receptor [Wenzhouxiangella sediminis]RFF29685.1 TonB-dependent receptor [Wenzhouxiangella sediminis]